MARPKMSVGHGSTGRTNVSQDAPQRFALASFYYVDVDVDNNQCIHHHDLDITLPLCGYDKNGLTVNTSATHL
jgi:hypothetical protein